MADFLPGEQRERSGARARGRSLLKKLRRGLWGFNCSPRLWLESSKTPFAGDAGPVTLLNAPRFLVTYEDDDGEEEKEEEEEAATTHALRRY